MTAPHAILLAYGCGWLAAVPHAYYVDTTVWPPADRGVASLLAAIISGLLWPVAVAVHFVQIVRNFPDNGAA